MHDQLKGVNEMATFRVGYVSDDLMTRVKARALSERADGVPYDLAVIGRRLLHLYAQYGMEALAAVETGFVPKKADAAPDQPLRRPDVEG